MDDRKAIMAWRRQTRAALIEARLALSVEAHRRISAAVFNEVDARFEASMTGRCVGLYWPFRRELDPLPFAARLIDRGAVVAMPVVVEAKAPLGFRAWTPGAVMAKGVWDIPYPADGPFIAPEVLIVSLVGFDEAGYRLGYGGGYYDRTLAASHPRPLTVGVGFESGRLPTIHPLPHDIAMDVVVAG